MSLIHMLISPALSSTIRHLQTSAPLPPAASSSSTTLPPLASTSRLPPLLPPTAPSPKSTSSALSLIASQSTPSTGRYLLARLHSRTYLLHPRDILTVPTLKPLSPPGTILALTRILEVGSRDYAIRSPAAGGRERRRELRDPGRVAGGWKDDIVPSWVARCGLTVLEHTKSPLELIVKKKRRQGYKKTIQHKQGWTRLRVGDIELGSGVEGEGTSSSSS